MVDCNDRPDRGGGLRTLPSPHWPDGPGMAKCARCTGWEAARREPPPPQGRRRVCAGRASLPASRAPMPARAEPRRGLMKSCRDGTAAFLTISLHHFVECPVYFSPLVKGGKGKAFATPNSNQAPQCTQPTTRATRCSHRREPLCAFQRHPPHSPLISPQAGSAAPASYAGVNIG
jgi:hypothetical protein